MEGESFYATVISDGSDSIDVVLRINQIKVF